MQKYFDITNIDLDKKYNLLLNRCSMSVPREGLAIKLQHAIHNLYTYYVDGKEVTEEEFLKHLKGVGNGKNTTR